MLEETSRRLVRMTETISFESYSNVWCLFNGWFGNDSLFALSMHPFEDI